jgi:cobalt-zinc-cadmium efflux system outer membrane protein
MKRVKVLVCFWVGLALIAGLGAQRLTARPQDGGLPVNLEELVEEALARNPRLAAAEKVWRASLEDIPQAKALPDPMLSFGHFFQSIETRLGPQRNKLSVSQRFPFFGKLSLKGRIAAEQAAVLEARYGQMKKDVILRVTEAFYTLFWFDEAVQITQQEKAVLDRLVEIARKKYASGTTGQQDALKAQLEISRLEDRIITLRQGRRSAVSRLNSLLNRLDGGTFEELEVQQPAPLALDLERLQAWAAEASPELSTADRVILKNDLQLDLAKKSRWPDLNVMLDYFDIGAGTATPPEAGRNAWMASVGINIPLWRGKLKAAEAEAAIRLEASQDTRQGVQNDTAARVSELYFEVKMYEDQMRLYEMSLIPQASQTLRAGEIGYIAGKGDFLSILDAERMLVQLRTALVKLKSERGKSLARLERAVGRTITGRE